MRGAKRESVPNPQSHRIRAASAAIVAKRSVTSFWTPARYPKAAVWSLVRLLLNLLLLLLLLLLLRVPRSSAPYERRHSIVPLSIVLALAWSPPPASARAVSLSLPRSLESARAQQGTATKKATEALASFASAQVAVHRRVVDDEVRVNLRLA